MKYKSYMHVEKFGNTEVEGIEIGTTVIMPKVDGSNGSTYLGDDNIIHAGSRNRELTLEKDNAGFYAHVLQNENLIKFHNDNPKIRLYGEWLVLHSLKTYRKDALRKFYVFDVYYEAGFDSEGEPYELPMPYDQYKPFLEQYNIDYIPPLKIIKNGDYESFIKELENNVFLIEDGKGVGEGIIIKNYNYQNKYGRTVWAKIVTSEFKEKHARTMGAPVHEHKMIEQEIVDKFLTTAFIEKEYEKIVNASDGWSSKNIPQLLQTVYYELIREECWNFIKALKNPTINFKTLNTLSTMKVKEIKSNLFS